MEETAAGVSLPGSNPGSGQLSACQEYARPKSVQVWWSWAMNGYRCCLSQNVEMELGKQNTHTLVMAKL